MVFFLVIMIRESCHLEVMYFYWKILMPVETKLYVIDDIVQHTSKLKAVKNLRMFVDYAHAHLLWFCRKWKSNFDMSLIQLDVYFVGFGGKLKTQNFFHLFPTKPLAFTKFSPTLEKGKMEKEFILKTLLLGLWTCARSSAWLGSHARDPVAPASAAG